LRSSRTLRVGDPKRELIVAWCTNGVHTNERGGAWVRMVCIQMREVGLERGGRGREPQREREKERERERTKR